MNMKDMVIVSVDDHVSEPPDMFDRHLSGAALESAPKFTDDMAIPLPFQAPVLE